MEFIPKYLAQKFSFFAEISILKFFILFFGSFFIIAIASTLLSERAASFVAPIIGAVIIISFAGFISAQHFSRKAWIPSSPLIVQFTSQPWFNSVLSLLSVIRNFGTLIFIHILMAMFLFIIVAPIVQAFGS